jgi:hypothetical protein
MTTYNVRIAKESNTKEQKDIQITQPDRTNLAYSKEIPHGWFFMSATPED